ncbi:MAG TPA: hypothetical protein DDW98_08730 [Gammaproteobacteria bacterium]|nr:hypothetical protein [Gammaproteobacteria bacterium]
MIAVRALRPYVMPEVPGCPVPLVDRAIVKAARDLCDKTFCWKEAATTASMQQGVAELEIEHSACAEIVALEYVSLNGLELIQTSERELSLCDLDWRTFTGEPTHVYTVISTGKMRLYPIPNRTLSNAISYEVYLKPKLDADDLPDFLQDQYAEVLQHGALYELQRMAGVKWANGEAAMFNRRMYRNGLYEVRDKTLRDSASQNLFIVPEPLV